MSSFPLLSESSLPRPGGSVRVHISACAVRACTREDKAMQPHVGLCLGCAMV